MVLGFISDIHEDVIRLEEALKILEKKGCEEIACLGDIVGYSYPAFGFFESRSAKECIRLVKENCKYAVAGNHDLYPVKRIPKFSAGFDYPQNWFELDYSERKKLAGEEVWLNEENEFNPLIDQKERDFLLSLPEFEICKVGNLKILLSHYLYPDLTGTHRQYYENFGPVEPHLNFIKENDCLLGFSGHKHIEGIFRADLNSQEYMGFGSHTLKEELSWIVGPCVANGKKDNGIMVFDTNSLVLEVIPLETPKRMMQVVNI